jgi:PKD repeat protein
VYEVEAEATDVHGQLMRGELSFLYDPTPLAPHVLDDDSELGVSIQDDDELEVEVEMSDAEIEALMMALFPIDWHKQRELEKIDQDTLRVLDAEGNDVSTQACGPAAAASCLAWFGDRFPNLDKDPAELARKLAKAAGTDSQGTDSDSLLAAIKKVLEDCGEDPDDWGVSIEFDPAKVYKDMVQGLNKSGTDKIPILHQKSEDDVNGDGVVNDDDVTGHYVTLSSRGSRYRDVMIPPTTHLMVIEKYVDFFNPATGQTEEYQIDDSKEPPELIGYEMNDASTGNAWIEGVICVRPPAGSSDRLAGGTACGWGHPLDEPVFEEVSVPGPGVLTWTKIAAELPFGPGPALLGVFGRDADGCVSGEHYTEILVGGFAHVDFTCDSATGEAPFVVQFANTTAPTDSVTGWEWDLDGDGIADSSEEHPTFTYDTPGVYSVSLRAHNPHGSDHRVYEDFIEVLDVVGTETPSDIPLATRLLPPAPNPLRGGTSLRFELSEFADVRVTVYDVQGRSIWSASRIALEAGPHAVAWDGRDRHRKPMASGVYFLRLETSAGVERWESVRIVR